MAGVLPPHVKEIDQNVARVAEDSLFWPAGHLFPEIREPLWPHRRFPLPSPHDDEDAAETDILLEVQAMGLQYTVLVQHRREPGLEVKPPADWDKRHFMWTDLPVFTEELCEWHYPQVQLGYNINKLDPPDNLRPDLNRPELLGFIPNGDIVAYWEVAEALADAFEIEIEALRSPVDHYHLVVAQNLDNPDALDNTPVGNPCEVGVLLTKQEAHHLPAACAFIQSVGGHPRVLHPAPSMFYRLLIPVLRCEWNFNRYVEAYWSSIGLSCQRLAAYDLRIIDNPSTRNEPIFATEFGNLVVDRDFFRFLEARLQALGAPSPGLLLPVVRIP